MKYRIIKNTTGNRIVYHVQYRWLFWWCTMKDFWCDHLGGYGEFDMEFISEESAQDYISRQHTTIEVCA